MLLEKVYNKSKKWDIDMLAFENML